MYMPQIIQGIDEFIAANKDLVMGQGAPTWQAGRDDGSKRLKIPIELNGELSGHYMHIEAYPEHQTLKFCLGLIVNERMVDRLDFDLEGGHTNGFGAAVPNVVDGPHWHSWELNRHTIKRKDHFWELPYAAAFETAVRFDASLRWYCAERHIVLGAHDIELPAPERLL